MRDQGGPGRVRSSRASVSRSRSSAAGAHSCGSRHVPWCGSGALPSLHFSSYGKRSPSRCRSVPEETSRATCLRTSSSSMRTSSTRRRSLTRTPGTPVLAGGLLFAREPLVARGCGRSRCTRSPSWPGSSGRSPGQSCGRRRDRGSQLLYVAGLRPSSIQRALQRHALCCRVRAPRAPSSLWTIERPTVSRGGGSRWDRRAALRDPADDNVVLLEIRVVPIFAARGRGRLLCSGAFCNCGGGPAPRPGRRTTRCGSTTSLLVQGGGAGLPLYPRSSSRIGSSKPENGPATRVFAVGRPAAELFLVEADPLGTGSPPRPVLLEWKLQECSMSTCSSSTTSVWGWVATMTAI